MSQLLSMLAVPFTLTTADSIAIVISGVTYTATVAAGTYRVNLATSTMDALRVLQAALNAAPSLPGGVSFAVALDGDTGLVTITCTGATCKLPDLYNSVIGCALGFSVTLTSYAASVTATRQPWYVAWFSGLYGGVWQAKRSGAIERTAGGVVYGFAGTLATEEREFTAEVVPWSPELCAQEGLYTTPARPSEAYSTDLAGTSTKARAWGLTDVWTAAQNGLCALAVGDWQTQRSSTSDRYFLGYVADTLPELTRADDRWQAFVTTKLRFVRPTSGASGTRA